ncbi:putative membrane protein YuiD [Ananas comosus]|uniref:Membrane protein YuiD n=2 Tax=Ananas comosus TaxID=4615 RepID=A0A6V7QH06_ANACO|nr:putative membrane protein YuiD [Ananas comosus]CAD1842308.1 unnamed protein product [Ananas comosus var. bracteatus]
MSTSSYSSSAAFLRLLPSSFSPSNRKPRVLYPHKRPTFRVSSLRLGFEEILVVTHNKVLVAATIAAAVGQLSKPLTRAINGDGIDLKAAIRSGGMPSTHSAGVIAAATSLGLERGFADSIFGMSVVFAAIVMYDAQGVRKEVGEHAKILNKMLSLQGKSTLNWDKDDYINSKSGISSINSEEAAPLISVPKKASTFQSNGESYAYRSSRVQSNKLSEAQSLKDDVTEPLEKAYGSSKPLNESVGHTKLQVLVGALLGFVVSLLIDVTL